MKPKCEVELMEVSLDYGATEVSLTAARYVPKKLSLKIYFNEITPSV